MSNGEPNAPSSPKSNRWTKPEIAVWVVAAVILVVGGATMGVLDEDSNKFIQQDGEMAFVKGDAVPWYIEYGGLAALFLVTGLTIRHIRNKS